MEREEALDQYLKRLRLQAGLSIEQVCQSTKIQSRYVEALEEGRFGELPSNTHLRAFSLSLAQASYGDSQRAGLLVRRVLIATGALAAPLVVDAPVLALVPAPEIRRPPAEKPLPLKSAAAVEIAREVATEAAEVAEGRVQNASLKLKALPWQAIVGLALAAAALSGGLLWSVHLWRERGAGVTVAAEEPLASTQEKSAIIAKTISATAEIVVPVATTSLVLRARRSCWLVLQVDGQKLPTVTLNEGEKRSWSVSQRAVLLAGNIGALRVWWRGDNLGYLGELSTRQNGIVFEIGKAFHIDKGANLSLPAGVPE